MLAAINGSSYDEVQYFVLKAGIFNILEFETSQLKWWSANRFYLVLVQNWREKPQLWQDDALVEFRK